MKFRFYKVSWGEEKEIEIKTLEELIELIKATERNQIIITESHSKDYEYDIVDYNDRWE
jgi:endonuclease IV